VQNGDIGDTTSIFDRDGFLERIGGNETFLRKLILSYIDSSTEHLAALGAAVGRADAAAIRRHAHSIKGAAANIGAGQLNELSAAIEAAAQAGDLAGMASHVAALERAFALFRVAAARELTE
jgi:HPt (histidine-containing phosphotransfer) domain-containing protein